MHLTETKLDAYNRGIILNTAAVQNIWLVGSVSREGLPFRREDLSSIPETQVKKMNVRRHARNTSAGEVSPGAHWAASLALLGTPGFLKF